MTTTWQHPYDFVGATSTDNLLNPDLSEEWVHEYLRNKGVVPSIQREITHVPDMGFSGFYNMYGILIVQIWEDHWRPLSLNSLKERLKANGVVPSVQREIVRIPDMGFSGFCNLSWGGDWNLPTRLTYMNVSFMCNFQTMYEKSQLCPRRDREKDDDRPKDRDTIGRGRSEHVRLYDGSKCTIKSTPRLLISLSPWTQITVDSAHSPHYVQNNLGTIAKSVQFSVRAVKAAKEPCEDNLEDNHLAHRWKQIVLRLLESDQDTSMQDALWPGTSPSPQTPFSLRSSSSIAGCPLEPGGQTWGSVIYIPRGHRRIHPQAQASAASGDCLMTGMMNRHSAQTLDILQATNVKVQDPDLPNEIILPYEEDLGTVGEVPCNFTMSDDENGHRLHLWPSRLGLPLPAAMDPPDLETLSASTSHDTRHPHIRNG
ncbi:hypothetical protein FDECE_6660 [Fusarium decemcellulare]|nr:hypothetical protein FDECE_6660 [Fusarium decemcellulare]